MKLRENFSKDFPCKFTPALVLHVLHLKGISFIHTRASLARAAFKWWKWRKVKLKGISFKGLYRVLSHPRYRPPTHIFMDEVKSDSESESESESIFGPLFFFNFRYIKLGVWGNNNIDIKKCTTIFLWVWYFGEVGEIFKNFQKHPRGESFWKNGV